MVLRNHSPNSTRSKRAFTVDTPMPMSSTDWPQPLSDAEKRDELLYGEKGMRDGNANAARVAKAILARAKAKDAARCACDEDPDDADDFAGSRADDPASQRAVSRATSSTQARSGTAGPDVPRGSMGEYAMPVDSRRIPGRVPGRAAGDPASPAPKLIDATEIWQGVKAQQDLARRPGLATGAADSARVRRTIDGLPAKINAANREFYKQSRRG